jgi:transglutaminase-like putative cysteine protease
LISFARARLAGARTSFAAPPMHLRLRKNLNCCVCDGRVIFLDIDADRYFALPPNAEEAFLRLAQGEKQEIGKLDGLLARGLLVEDEGRDGLQLGPNIPAATADFLDELSPQARTADVARALAAEMGAAWRVKRRPFANVIAWAAGSPTAAPRSGDPDMRLRRLASASAAASYFLRATDRCLVRALALHSICKHFGIGSRLVFGVRINPFAAHCWVQHGDAILIGDFEQVRLFTPIKVVG